VKYWGKRNREFNLPLNGSISMTTEGLHSHTTVEFSEKYKEDVLMLNGKEFRKGSEEYDEYVGSFLRAARQMAGSKLGVKIVSENNFPTAAGLASSASGFAALALAVSKALGMNLGKRNLSMLARIGSGSASRSIHGGFVEWKKGSREDGSDCYAEMIAPPDHWPEFRMIACVTSRKAKKIKSRAGMKKTVETSPMYSSWLETVNKDLEGMRKGIANRDFTAVGRIAEENCLKMHATMMTTKPQIIYWNPTTVEILQSVMEWRDQGLESYFTMDAGPQVKILCMEKNVKEISKRLEEIKGIESILVTFPGKEARNVENHLF